jgi:hypothetical protein
VTVRLALAHDSKEFSLRTGRHSRGFAQTLRMKITTRKIGGIWHGYLEGHPEIDERALTEEIAQQKVERILDMWVDDEMGQFRRDES